MIRGHIGILAIQITLPLAEISFKTKISNVKAFITKHHKCDFVR